MLWAWCRWSLLTAAQGLKYPLEGSCLSCQFIGTMNYCDAHCHAEGACKSHQHVCCDLFGSNHELHLPLPPRLAARLLDQVLRAHLLELVTFPAEAPWEGTTCQPSILWARPLATGWQQDKLLKCRGPTSASLRLGDRPLHTASRVRAWLQGESDAHAELWPPCSMRFLTASVSSMFLSL